MTLVKSNLCPTCGGLLDIDLDKQMYVCTYCGVSFDYEYFREDNVKEIASKAINRGEYGAAKDAYDFMLKKDPHDFDALRGLFICRNKWKSMNIMHRDTEVHVSSDDPALQNAIDNCLPKNRPYFEKVREALDELKHYRELTGESNAISKSIGTEQKILGKLKNDYYYNTHKFTEFYNDLWEEMDGKQRESFLTLVIVLPLVTLGMIIWGQAWWMLIFILIIVALVIGGYHLIKFIETRQILASMIPYQDRLKELTEQKDAKDDEVKQSHLRYKALVKEFMAMDPTPQKAEESTEDEKQE